MLNIIMSKLRLQIGTSIFMTLALAGCNSSVKVQTRTGVNPAKSTTSDTQSSVKIVSPQDGANANSLNYKIFSLAGTCVGEASKIILSTIASDQSTKTLGTAICSKSIWNADVDLSDVSDRDVKIFASASTPSGTKSTPVSLAIKKDTTLPTVTLTTSATSFNISPIAMQLTLSESVTGLTLAKFTTSNVTLSNLSGSGTAYTFDASPDSNGSFSIALSSGSVFDLAGNPNLASSTFTQVFNNASPTVVISSAASAVTSTSPIPVTVTFSAAVTGFNASKMTLVNGTVSAFAGSGTTYTFNLTPSSQGVVSVDIAAAAVTDTSSNPNIAAAQFTRTYDTVVPTVVISSTSSSTTNLALIPVTVTFSEAVTGFTSAGVTLTGATLSSFAGSGTTYTFNVAPTGQGAITINVPLNKAQDAAGNNNTAATQLSRTYDSVVPTVVISSTAAATTKVSPIPVTVTFSESVTGFTSAGVTLGNGSISGFAGSGTTYTFNVTPTAQGAVTIDVPANSAQDAAGNNNTVATQLSRTYDNVAPTVNISSTAGASTLTSPIPVTVTFSESVTGFTSGGVTLGNGAISSFVGSGTTYTFNVTPTGQGAVTVNVGAGVAQDAATNNNTAATQYSRTYDTTAPTVAITSTASSSTNVSPIPVTVTFNESVTGFTSSGVTVGNGTVSGFAGSGTTYTFNVTPTAQGAVTINVGAGVAQDAAGNSNTAATQLSRTYDSVVPTVVISSTAAATTKTSPIPVTVTFSESVTGFTSAGVTLGNGSISGFAGSGTTYTFNVTPTAQGAVTIDVPASSAQDAAGNNNTVATQLSRTYDNVAPTVTISSSASSSTPTSPIPVTVTFSESVTGFTSGGVTVGNGSISGFAGSGTTYTFSVTPTGQGAVTVNVGAGVAQDVATNNNTAATQLSRTYDSVAPTVVISSTAGASTNVSPVPITITFSESVTGFTFAGVTVAGGTL